MTVNTLYIITALNYRNTISLNAGLHSEHRFIGQQLRQDAREILAPTYDTHDSAVDKTQVNSYLYVYRQALSRPSE